MTDDDERRPPLPTEVPGEAPIVTHHHLPLWTRVALVVIGGFMVLSAALMVAGYVAYRTEVDARIDGQCEIITKTRKVLESVVLFATKPTSLEGLTPERRAVVVVINRQRLQARHDYLPRISVLSCEANDSSS